MRVYVYINVVVSDAKTMMDERSFYDFINTQFFSHFAFYFLISLLLVSDN